MILPAEYKPYTTIRLCGNTLKEVGFIFKIADQAPLLIGKGDNDTHPWIWLYGRMGIGGVWMPLVEKNVVVHAQIGNPYDVIQDARKPVTVVTVGSLILVSAAHIDSDTVEVPTIDLRPIGLNIFGTSASGLNFGGGRFTSNTMHSVATAFGSAQ